MVATSSPTRYYIQYLYEGAWTSEYDLGYDESKGYKNRMEECIVEERMTKLKGSTDGVGTFACMRSATDM